LHFRTFHGTTEFGLVTTLLTYRDRNAAGQVLAEQLRRFTGRDGLQIVALPRGGLPIGVHVARALRAPLDVLLIHRLGFPGAPEIAMGALASGGVCVLNSDVLREREIDAEAMKQAVSDALPELEARERAIRGDREPLDVRGRPVIIVDDGLATGATMRVAIAGLRAQSPSSITIAVPVGVRQAIERLASEVDEVICPRMPEPFFAVGLSYDRFPEVDEDDAREFFAAAQWNLPSFRRHAA
jgi:predicted phosphoribosyltransferase